MFLTSGGERELVLVRPDIAVGDLVGIVADRVLGYPSSNSLD